MVGDDFETRNMKVKASEYTFRPPDEDLYPWVAMGWQIDHELKRIIMDKATPDHRARLEPMICLSKDRLPDA